LTFGAPGEGGLGVSLEVMLLLLQVVAPVMTLRLHSPRLEVAIVQQKLHLLCGFTPTGKFLGYFEHLCKFYPSGDIFGSVPVYVT
jgi:hypothetical protein